MKNKVLGLVLSATYGVTAIMSFVNKSVKDSGSMNLSFDGFEMSSCDGTYTKVLREMFSAEPIRFKKDITPSLFNGKPIQVKNNGDLVSLSGYVTNHEIPEFTVTRNNLGSGPNGALMRVDDATAVMFVDADEQTFGGHVRISKEFHIFSDMQDSKVLYPSAVEAASDLRHEANTLLRIADELQKAFDEANFIEAGPIPVELSLRDDEGVSGYLRAEGDTFKIDPHDVKSIIAQDLFDTIKNNQKRKDLQTERAALEAKLARNNEALQALG